MIVCFAPHQNIKVIPLDVMSGVVFRKLLVFALRKAIFVLTANTTTKSMVLSRWAIVLCVSQHLHVWFWRKVVDERQNYSFILMTRLPCTTTRTVKWVPAHFNCRNMSRDQITDHFRFNFEGFCSADRERRCLINIFSCSFPTCPRTIPTQCNWNDFQTMLKDFLLSKHKVTLLLVFSVTTLK